MCITAVSVLFLSMICFSISSASNKKTKFLYLIKLAGYPVRMDKKLW